MDYQPYLVHREIIKILTVKGGDSFMLCHLTSRQGPTGLFVLKRTTPQLHSQEIYFSHLPAARACMAKHVWGARRRSR